MKVGDKIRVVAAQFNCATSGETCAYETGDEGTIVSWLPHCKDLLAVDFGKPLPGRVWVKECELVVEKSVERRVDTVNVVEKVRNMKACDEGILFGKAIIWTKECGLVVDKVIMKDTAEMWNGGERRATLWTKGDEGIVDEVFPASDQVRVKFPNGKTGLCEPGDYDILPTAPAPVKRGIRIQAQETKTGDIEILGITGLSKSHLPDMYLDGFPRVIYGNSQLYVQKSRNVSQHVVAGQVYSQIRFDEILAVCEAAGLRLREINERRSEPFEVVI